MRWPGVGEVVLGRFRLDTPLGRGATGQVYAGADQRDGASVAVKVMHPLLASAYTARKRFTREAEALARVSHARVPRFVASGFEGAAPVLVTERLWGEDLQSMIERAGRLSADLALAVAAGVADGLDAAHRVGVLHRDVKPANVFCVGGAPAVGAVRVLDFGAALCADLSRVTASVDSVGTPRFRAPEQDGAVGAATPASDVYSLGLTLRALARDRSLDPRTERYIEMLTSPDPMDRPCPAGVVAMTLRALAAGGDGVLDVPSGLVVPPTAPRENLERARRCARELRAASMSGWRLRQSLAAVDDPPVQASVDEIHAGGRAACERWMRELGEALPPFGARA